MSAKRLLLLRHAPLQEVPDGICFGQSDFPSSTLSAAQLEWICAQFGKAARIISSPLQRARTLAEDLTRVTNIEVEINSKLAELSFGLWEGKTWTEIEREYPMEYAAWLEDFVQISPPMGESFSALQQRAVSALQAALSEQASGTDLVFVTHAGVIRAILAWVLSMPLQHAFRIQVDHLSLSEINFHQHGPVISYTNQSRASLGRFKLGCSKN